MFTIEVNVKTNKRLPNIKFVTSTQCEVDLKSSPLENKANIELISMLSKHYNIPKKCISIKHGVKSKHKFIEIENGD